MKIEKENPGGSKMKLKNILLITLLFGSATLVHQVQAAEDVAAIDDGETGESSLSGDTDDDGNRVLDDETYDERYGEEGKSWHQRSARQNFNRVKNFFSGTRDVRASKANFSSSSPEASSIGTGGVNASSQEQSIRITADRGLTLQSRDNRDNQLVQNASNKAQVLRNVFQNGDSIDLGKDSNSSFSYATADSDSLGNVKVGYYDGEGNLQTESLDQGKAQRLINGKNSENAVDTWRRAGEKLGQSSDQEGDPLSALRGSIDPDGASADEILNDPGINRISARNAADTSIRSGARAGDFDENGNLLDGNGDPVFGDPDDSNSRVNLNGQDTRAVEIRKSRSGSGYTVDTDLGLSKRFTSEEDARNWVRGGGDPVYDYSDSPTDSGNEEYDNSIMDSPSLSSSEQPSRLDSGAQDLEMDDPDDSYPALPKILDARTGEEVDPADPRAWGTGMRIEKDNNLANPQGSSYTDSLSDGSFY